MATIGGEAVAADPDSELVAALMALNAVFLVSHPAEPRESPALRFLRDPQRDLAGGGVLRALVIPGAPDGAALERVAALPSLPPIVSVAVTTTLSGDKLARVRIAVTGLDGPPARVLDAESKLERTSGEDDVLEAAASLVADHVPFRSDAAASAASRRRMARPLALRALGAAIAHARRRQPTSGPRARPAASPRVPAPLPNFTSGRVELQLNGRAARLEAEARTTLLELVRSAGTYGAKAGCGTRALRRVRGAARRAARRRLPDARGSRPGAQRRHARRPGLRRAPPPAADRLRGSRCLALRVLHAGPAARGACPARRGRAPERGGRARRARRPVPLHRLRAPGGRRAGRRRGLGPAAVSLRLATGQAAFAGDHALPGMLHVALRRSTAAHARVRAADAGAARQLPGVAAVLLAADAPLVLGDVARFVGDRLAVVAAEEPELARRAAELVEFDLEALPAELDAAAAAADERAVAGRLSVSEGDVERALGEAEHVVSGEWSLPFAPALPLEPPLAFTWLDEDRRLVVRTTAESPFRVRGPLAERLALPAARIRVVRPAVAGGGLGRSDLGLEDACALVTLRTGRPAQLALLAHEAVAIAQGRPAQRVGLRLGLARGAIVGLDVRLLVDVGADDADAVPLLRAAARQALGLYRLPSLRVTAVAVRTNRPPSCAPRGSDAGVAIALECALDEAAALAEQDPAALRRAHLRRPGDPGAVALAALGEPQGGDDSRPVAELLRGLLPRRAGGSARRAGRAAPQRPRPRRGPAGRLLRGHGREPRRCGCSTTARSRSPRAPRRPAAPTSCSTPTLPRRSWAFPRAASCAPRRTPTRPRT